MSAADELAADAARIDELTVQVVDDSVDIYTDTITARLRRDTGGDYRLSGLRDTTGRRLTVDSDIVDQGDTVTGRVAAAPRSMLGAWRMLEDGTRPRLQGSGRHPGTRAKSTFTDPVDRADDDIDRQIERRFAAVLP